MSAVVSDSSPLNYLALLSDFDLLRRIYGTLVIPPAVYSEVVKSGLDYPVAAAVQAALGKWVSVASAPDAGHVASLQREYRLDLGESEAILVAESLGRIPLLMDERRGVKCARSRGLAVIRTPLIYADARILGLVASVRAKLDELRANGFHLSDRHYSMHAGGRPRVRRSARRCPTEQHSRNQGTGRPERPPQAESLPHFESSRVAKILRCSSTPVSRCSA